MSLKKIISKIPFISFKSTSADSADSYNSINIGVPMEEYKDRLLESDQKIKEVDNEFEENEADFHSLDKLRDFNVFAKLGEDENIFLYSEDIRKIKTDLIDQDNTLGKSPYDENDEEGILQIRWRKVLGCKNGKNAYVIIPCSNPFFIPDSE